MEIIDKEKLKKLIEDLYIEDIHITESILDVMDLTTLDIGRKHQPRRDGTVKIIISGRVSEPDNQL